MDLDEPFTPATAARAGLGRAALDRMYREGRVLRLLRGVYLDAGTPQTSIIRARALALVVSSKQVVDRRTAAWVHGAVSTTRTTSVDLHGRWSPNGTAEPLRAGDVSVIGGVRCTSPVRTALDLGRHLTPDRALPLLDGLLRAQVVSHLELLGASSLPRWCDAPGIARYRELTALADGRAGDPAESVLRLRWLAADLPTPVPAMQVERSRLALGLGTQRFGVALARRIDEAALERCRVAGWQVLVLPDARVLGGDPHHLADHLEREFHQHLLREVG